MSANLRINNVEVDCGTVGWSSLFSLQSNTNIEILELTLSKEYTI